jgi:hypothetical protein
VEVFLVIFVVMGVVFGLLGAWIASQKNRSEGEGLALGCIFGPFGALIEALMPTMQDEGPRPLQSQATGWTSVEAGLPKERSGLRPEEVELLRKQQVEVQAKQAALRAKRDADEAALAEFRRMRESEIAALDAFNQREEKRLAREREEQKHLSRQKWQARRQRLADLPEGVKILVSVIVGLAAIVAVFAIILRLVG